MALLDDVKISLRVTTNAYDSELNGLIDSAKRDLRIAGVVVSDTESELDSVTITAIKTYVKMNFGNPSNYDNLKKSYDEQKAQMSMATGYTDWGNP
jgi:hypothetical protein